jgi:hypothetical protein
MTGCAGLAAGAIQSRGFGLEGGERDTLSPLVNATASVRTAVRVFRSVFVQAGATLSVPMARTLYEARAEGNRTVELFEQGALAGEFELGLGTGF